ncbi:hypothetical protein HanRHA438_Chr04g0162771 [Helianthus annuus]|uniref:Uncharacterized protein n=1 Tax=Helianthus annuus TaxID=4232 RepID=A0A251RP85_HELAN|nr:hypothetical protein HanXRQr2_Chr04g0152631 [Helianthus annuus]KAJ0580114.1 hypothetical protein HanHA300_Chr04g0125551 [Helianthus annuus]KAJ0596050.1 hypothetical protein HanHA89_Chr04g0138361 [Helianthus annuus]KAJ0756699.1 hypothetical protein HanLR1_Chr04g0130091 [Helianthus annuus]KAJ0760449.1 hypothetical protein HanOQP8_Chr04g0138131 [Helianthus annuus]
MISTTFWWLQPNLSQKPFLCGSPKFLAVYYISSPSHLCRFTFPLHVCPISPPQLP